MRRSPVALLIALQLLLIGAAGLVTVARFPVWALVDELAHFDYAVTIGQDARLPVLDEDLVSSDALALGGQTGEDPAGLGLRGESYEAFQPPLYYALLAPVAAAGGERMATVRIMRAVGLVLLGIGAWLTWLLALRVFGDDDDPLAAPAAFALALCVFFLPAFVIRGVTIANTALALPLALAVVLLCWDALEREDARRLLAAGFVLGLGLLTRLELAVLAPLLVGVAWLLWRRGAVRTAPAVGAVALPVVLLAPWLGWNLHRYGALTASDLARDMQEPALNPTGATYGADALVDGAKRVFGGALPEEWWSRYLSSGWRVARDVLAAVVILGPAGLAAVRPPERITRALTFLVAPLVLTAAALAFVLLAGQFDLLKPRYLHPVLPAYALFVALVLRRWLSARGVAMAAAVATAAITVLWLVVAGGPTYTGA